jgi:hypothetical protein
LKWVRCNLLKLCFHLLSLELSPESIKKKSSNILGQQVVITLLLVLSSYMLLLGVVCSALGNELVSYAEGPRFDPSHGQKFVTSGTRLYGPSRVFSGYSGFLPPFKLIQDAANIKFKNTKHIFLSVS